MEVYCKNCGFSYVDEDKIPEDEEVLQIGCDCGKFHILHRCEQGKYSPMSVREVHAHEIEDRKKDLPPRTDAKTVTRKPKEIDENKCNKQWVCGLAHSIKRKKEGKRWVDEIDGLHTCKLEKNHEGKCVCSCGVVGREN